MQRPESTRSLLLVAAGLALVALLPFVQVVEHQFVSYDDDRYITGNPVVRQGLTAEGLRWSFTTGHASNWHPLTWISHMLDIEMFGTDPTGHHLHGVILHALSAVLLFLALRRMTGSGWPCLLSALLFADCCSMRGRCDGSSAQLSFGGWWRSCRWLRCPPPPR